MEPATGPSVKDSVFAIFDRLVPEKRAELISSVIAHYGLHSRIGPLLKIDTAKEFVWRMTGQETAALRPFDRLMERFMRQRTVRCGALAVARNGRLVLSRGYTWDLPSAPATPPRARFRIASISKPITAAAVMKLVEDGRLKLSDKMTDLLALSVPPHPSPSPRSSSATSSSAPAPKSSGRRKKRPAQSAAQRAARADQRAITVEHLLLHSAGFDSDSFCDPMFEDEKVAKFRGKKLPVTCHDIIAWMARQPLQFRPGEEVCYSNYGYCLLGRIIEAASGKSYAQFVTDSVLRPLGMVDTVIGRTERQHQPADEVPYFTFEEDEKSVLTPDQPFVPQPYGSWNHENLDAHGGWVSSTVDLLRFMCAFDDPERSPLLAPSSFRSMFAVPPTGLDDGAFQGFGWMVRPVTAESVKGNTAGVGCNVWHNGSLPGTYSLLVRRHDGLSWAVLFNQRDDPSDLEYDVIDEQLHEAADAVTCWPSEGSPLLP